MVNPARIGLKTIGLLVALRGSPDNKVRKVGATQAPIFPAFSPGLPALSPESLRKNPRTMKTILCN